MQLAVLAVAFLGLAAGARIGPSASRQVVSRGVGSRKLSSPNREDHHGGPMAQTSSHIVDHRMYSLNKHRQRRQSGAGASAKSSHNGFSGGGNNAMRRKMHRGHDEDVEMVVGYGGLPLVSNGQHLSALDAGKNKKGKKSSPSHAVRRKSILEDDKFFLYVNAT